MGVSLTTRIEETPEATRINLEGEDGGVLIRRGGEGLQALQHLVATTFRKQLGDDNRIVIDCNGFRRDKDAELRQMAQLHGREGAWQRRPQEMGPLNPYERRIVHMAIAEDPTVSSESIGDAFLKTVIISASKPADRRWRQSMFAPDDTIVAIATPPGRAGIGVVRISGRMTLDVARALLERAPLQPRRATFTRLRTDGTSRQRPALDEVVATWFAAPHSYTGQHVVEISAHGSPVVLQAIVRAPMRAGARLARPGEFTLRAFLNGKRDLIQAEAVADLVDAATPLQAQVAFDQLDGTLTRRIAAIDAGALRSDRAAGGVARLSRRGLSLHRAGEVAGR